MTKEYIRMGEHGLEPGPDWEALIEEEHRRLAEARMQTEAEQEAADEAWQRYCENPLGGNDD